MAGKFKILAVDDNPEVLGILRGFLENQYDYLGALNAEQAWDYFLDNADIDVVFLDMLIGPRIEMSMKLAHNLRGAGYQGFIVVLSACPADSNGWQLLRRAGANDILEKCSDIGEKIFPIIEKAKRFNRNIYPPERV